MLKIDISVYFYRILTLRMLKNHLQITKLKFSYLILLMLTDIG